MGRTAVTNKRLLVRNYAGSMVNAAASGRLTIPNVADMIPNSTSFWFAATVRLDSTNLPASTHVLAEYGAYDSNGWLLNAFGNDLYVYVSGGGPVATFTNFFSGTNGKWTRIFVSFVAVDSRIRAYRNGVLFGTSSAISAWNITSNGVLSVAYSHTIVGGGAIGNYQDVQYGVGATVAGASDASDDYYLGVVAPTAVHRYKLDATSGTTAADSIGSNNGTLSSSATFTASNSWLRSRSSTSNRTTVTTTRKVLPLFANVPTPVVYFTPSNGVIYDGGNAVSAWYDSGSDLSAIQLTASARPTYSPNGFGTGIPGISFDGTNDQLDFQSNGALTNAKNWTLYIVVKPNNLTGVRYIASFGGNAGGYAVSINNGGAGKREIIGKSVGVCQDGAATTNAEIWCVSRDNAGTANLSMSVNGVSQSLDVPTTSINNLTSFNYLGSRAAANFYSGLIGHVLLYSIEHGAPTKNIIINALNQIYSIF